MRRKNARVLRTHWYWEKPPACCDLAVEPCQGLEALELHCFLWASSAESQAVLTNIVHLKFILESSMNQMMHPSASHHRNLFLTLHPIQYRLCVCVYWTHTAQGAEHPRVIEVCYTGWSLFCQNPGKGAPSNPFLMDKAAEKQNPCLLEKKKTAHLLGTQ